MELVYTTNSDTEANEIKLRLEEAGIPCMIAGNNVASIRLPFLAGNLSVFIYINNQYEDAMALLSDPGHEVETAVDVEAFYQAMESADMKQYIERKTNQVIIVLALVILLVISILIILD